MIRQLDNAFLATMEMVLLQGDNHIRVMQYLRECVGIAKSAFWMDIITATDYIHIAKSLEETEMRIRCKMYEEEIDEL